MGKIRKEKDYIIYNNRNIYFIISYKKVKNISIRIKECIYVTAPINVHKSDITNFLYININKILIILDKKNNNLYYNLEKNILRILGENFIINCNENAKRNTWKIIDNTIKINLKNKNEKEKVIRKVLKEISENYILSRTEKISNELNIKYKSINLKWMTSKWGYCDKYNNIVFSTKTVILDRDMIDYIIVHELCHTIEHNHSINFWKLVAKFLPNYKETIKKIKLINLI